jgi:hypothetical protein
MRKPVPGRPWLLGILAVVIGSFAASPPGHAASATPVEREEEHAASRLAVAGLVGSLQIERHEQPGIRLVLRGSAEAIGRVRREVRGDLLQLTAEAGPGGTTSVVSASNNTVIALGGRATLSIGSVTTSAGSAQEAEPPLELQVYVPAATPLAITGLVGDLSVEGVGGPVDLELISGRAQLDRVRGGSLAVVGGSHIEVAEATGDLRVAVRAAGDVVVADAVLDRLEVSVSGTGNVIVGGVAERATVQIAGVGNVAIDEVRERPEVTVAGIGRVEIGNW